MKKKTSKIPKTKSIDFERETRVLLEEIRHSVKTVAEGHSVLVQKLEDHDKKFEEHDKRFNNVESVLGTIKMAVMELSSSAKATDAKLKAIGEKLDENLSSYGKRITKLEEKVLI